MKNRKGEEASRRDVDAFQNENWDLLPVSTPSQVYMIRHESDFAWSDDSWDPMTTEYVSVVSTEELAKRMISSGLCPPGYRYRAGRSAFDYRAIPLVASDQGWPRVSKLHVVFETQYQSILHYGDEHGRTHDQYRTDSTGFPDTAFQDPGLARQRLTELTHHYRVDEPRLVSPWQYQGGRNADAPDWPSSERLSEFTSLEPEEFRARVQQPGFIRRFHLQPLSAPFCPHSAATLRTRALGRVFGSKSERIQPHDWEDRRLSIRRSRATGNSGPADWAPMARDE